MGYYCTTRNIKDDGQSTRVIRMKAGTALYDIGVSFKCIHFLFKVESFKMI
jgi:hypothetical protein